VGVRAAFGPRGLVEGFSLKLPTGTYRIGGEFGGGIQDPALQPGTGAWAFVGLLQYSRRSAALGIDWSVAASYEATTTNALDYRFGNQAILTAGVSRSLSGPLTASLQAKLFHQDRSQYLGQGVPSTGSTTLYLTPGLRLAVPRGLSLYAFVLFSPYRYVNEAQLAPRIAVLAGLSKLL
jgi:Putative MetA-pathway of phenol degradation